MQIKFLKDFARGLALKSLEKLEATQEQAARHFVPFLYTVIIIVNIIFKPSGIEEKNKNHLP